MSAEQYAAMVATPDDFPDGPQIVAMLRPRDGRADAFACANFEPATRRCRIYDTRPQLCAVYPSGGACPHCHGDGLDA
jgi:Fe-S-cluster containining protein